MVGFIIDKNNDNSEWHLYASNDLSKDISYDELLDCPGKEPIRSKLVNMTDSLYEFMFQ